MRKEATEAPGAVQDLERKTSDYLSQVVLLSEGMSRVLKQAEELTAYRKSNGFEAGQPNEVTQDDCIGDNAHLTPAVVDAVVQVGAALTGVMTLPRWDSLRKANRSPYG